MEKRKLLLVAISVGVFLVISIVAAIMFFQPKNSSGSVAGAAASTSAGVTQPGVSSVPPPSYQLPSSQPPSSVSAPVDAVDLVRNPSEVPGLRSAPEGTAPQSSDYYVTGSGTGTETVINVPKPSSAAIPTAAPAGRAAAAPKPAEPRPAEPRPAAPIPAVRPAAPRPAAQTTVQQPKPAAPKPAVQTRVYDDFWVQTGAFSTMARAQGVKETLANKGITSLIENRDVNGQTVFRVRVGPYTSQNEANYWLALIKSISGFEDSQVRQTQSTR